MQLTRRSVCGLFLATTLPGISEAKLFIPTADLWALWDSADQSNDVVIDHSAWQALLDTYLATQDPSGIHRFDYSGAKESGRADVRAYIDRLASLDPRQYNRMEQLAYWINLYNALTIDVVLQKYPVKSIRDVYGGIIRLGPWNRVLVEIAGHPLTLNDIEHRILRPIYADPRIHYSLNCASLGCPNLAAQAYTGRNVDALLSQGGRAYVNHPRGASFVNGRLSLSKIYYWFAEDFGDDEAGVIGHLASLADPELAMQLRNYTGRVRYAYDWRLNVP